MVAPGVVVIWLHADPALLATRYDSSDAHRPAYGPSVEGFLADQAAEREPWLTAVHAHVIDVDNLTPDEEVTQAMKVLASIEP
jgi:shikimate kinase